jgi:hypothetical protein
MRQTPPRINCICVSVKVLSKTASGLILFARYRKDPDVSFVNGVADATRAK